MKISEKVLANTAATAILLGGLGVLFMWVYQWRTDKPVPYPYHDLPMILLLIGMPLLIASQRQKNESN